MYIQVGNKAKKRHSDNDNRKKWFENENEKTTKDKRFSFLPTHKPTLRKNQRAKSSDTQFLNE